MAAAITEGSVECAYGVNMRRIGVIWRDGLNNLTSLTEFS